MTEENRNGFPVGTSRTLLRRVMTVLSYVTAALLAINLDKVFSDFGIDSLLSSSLRYSSGMLGSLLRIVTSKLAFGLICFLSALVISYWVYVWENRIRSRGGPIPWPWLFLRVVWSRTLLRSSLLKRFFDLQREIDDVQKLLGLPGIELPLVPLQNATDQQQIRTSREYLALITWGLAKRRRPLTRQIARDYLHRSRRLQR